MIQRIRFTLGCGRVIARALLQWAMLLVLMVGPAAAGDPSKTGSAEPEVVARVNGEPVMRSELQRMVVNPNARRLYQHESGAKKVDGQEFTRWALRKLIVKRLALQEAARRNIKVAEQDLDRAVALWKARMKGAKKAEKYLKSRGLDEKSLRDAFRTDLLAGRVSAAVTQDVRVTEEQLQEYYEAHKAELQLPEEVRLRIIAVKDRAAADEVVAAVHRGEEFDRLARERSMEARAAEVGDRRWLAVPGLPPSLRAAVDRLKLGETSEPLQGSAEHIVVRLEARRPARTKSLAEARPEIERNLLPAKRQEVFQAWMAEQERKSRIEVFLQPGSTNEQAMIPQDQLMVLEEKEP